MSEFKKFLEAYKKICEKYGCHIDGCGCCFSPFVLYNNRFGPDSIDLDDHIKHLEDEHDE